MGGKDLTEDQIASIRDGSSLFDTDGDGRIAPSELGVLKPEPFDRPLRDAFRVLEQIRERSFTDLRHILSSIGEKLEPHEFDEWIREVDVAPDGTIRYDDFIRCSSESSGSEEDAGGGNGAGSSGPRFLGPGAAVRWGSSESRGSEEDAGGGGGAGSSGPRFLGPGAAVRWSSSESWLVDGARSRRAGLREAGGDGESLALGIDSERRSGDAERDGDRVKMPRLLEPRFVVFFFFFTELSLFTVAVGVALIIQILLL